MALNDLVDRKDIIRVMLVSSSIFMIVATFYAVFIHSQYTGQINNVRLNLIKISDWLNQKASNMNGTKAVQYKQLARTAMDISRGISGPKLNPYAYVYLNYWITSAAFTQLFLSYTDLGLDNKTVQSMEKLENLGWFKKGVLEKPSPRAYPWTYYIFVLLIVSVGTWIGVRNKYETPMVPYIICATISLIPFWGVFIFGTIIALLLGVIRPETVSFGAYAVAFVVTLVLSAFAGAIAGAIRERRDNG